MQGASRRAAASHIGSRYSLRSIPSAYLHRSTPLLRINNWSARAVLHPRGRLIVAGPPRHRFHASASRGTATKDCEQDPVVVISAETRVVGVRARDEMTCARQWYKRAPGVMQMTRRHLASSHHRPSVRDRIARRQSSFHFAPSHPYRNCLCLRSSAVPVIRLWPANPSSLRCAFDSR